jgi:hypothetical protein
MGTGVLSPGVKRCQGVTHLVPRSRMSRAILPLLLVACMAVAGHLFTLSCSQGTEEGAKVMLHAISASELDVGGQLHVPESVRFYPHSMFTPRDCIFYYECFMKVGPSSWLCLWTVFSIRTGFTNDVFLSSLYNWELRWNVSDRKITDQLSHPCKAARRLTGKQLTKQVSERQNEASPYCKLCTADLIASWSRLKYFCGHLTHRAQTDISAFWNACSRNIVIFLCKHWTFSFSMYLNEIF